MARAHAQADVLAQPSSREGFGLAATETLAAPVRHHLSPTASATRTLTGYTGMSAL